MLQCTTRKLENAAGKKDNELLRHGSISPRSPDQIQKRVRWKFVRYVNIVKNTFLIKIVGVLVIGIDIRKYVYRCTKVGVWTPANKHYHSHHKGCKILHTMNNVLVRH